MAYMSLSCGQEWFWKENDPWVVRCLILDTPEEHPLQLRGADLPLFLLPPWHHRTRNNSLSPRGVGGICVNLAKEGVTSPHYFPLISKARSSEVMDVKLLSHSGTLINICWINEWINSKVVQKYRSLIIAIYFIVKAWKGLGSFRDHPPVLFSFHSKARENFIFLSFNFCKHYVCTQFKDSTSATRFVKAKNSPQSPPPFSLPSTEATTFIFSRCLLVLITLYPTICLYCCFLIWGEDLF